MKEQQKKSKKAKQRARKAAANQSVNGQQTEAHAAVAASDTILRTTQVALKNVETNARQAALLA